MMHPIRLPATRLEPVHTGVAPHHRDELADASSRLPTVHWVPLLPPDRDDPPYDALLANGVSFCPELGAVLVGRWWLVRKVIGNKEDFALDHSRDRMLGCAPDWARDCGSSGGRRAVLVRAFGPDRVEFRVQRMRRWAGILVDRLRPAGHADLEAQFAGPFVARVLNDMIGFPATDDQLIGRFRGAADVLARDTNPHPNQPDQSDQLDQFDAADLCGRALRYLTRLVARHWFAGQNLISDLVHAGLDPDKIFHLTLTGWSPAEQATRNLLLCAVRDMLTTHSWPTPSPDRPVESCIEGGVAGCVEGCVEESLRRWSPHGTVLRHTTTAVTLAQRHLPAGTPVGLVLGAANLDPAVFPGPREFHPARGWLDRHLAFGHGPHRCPGAALARTATRIAIEALSRLPNLHLADSDQRERKAHPFLTGPDEVALAWGDHP